jgi:hypothetical protein
MQRFRHMALEQIDAMDYRRLMQALAAEGILEVEAKRLMLIQGRIDKLNDMDEEAIARHDELVGTASDGPMLDEGDA